MVTPWQHLRVLIAGCGSIGKRHGRVLRELGITDLGACDPCAVQRESWQSDVPDATCWEHYETALAAGADVVVICTPPALHVPMAVQAIRAGCHVLIEKPLSDTLEGISDLAAMAEQKQRKVMVALCCRYHEGLRRARTYLEQDRVGRLVSIRAMVGEYLPDVRPDYRDRFFAETGGAFDLIHEIDLAIWYANRPTRAVRALYGSYSDIGLRAPDVAEILVDFEDCCLAAVHLDFFQRPRRRQLELLGTEGTIVVEYADWNRCRVSQYAAASAAWQHEELTTARDDMFRAEDREFLVAVAEDRPVQCALDEAVKSVEVVLAARRGGADLPDKGGT